MAQQERASEKSMIKLHATAMVLHLRSLESESSELLDEYRKIIRDILYAGPGEKHIPKEEINFLMELCSKCDRKKCLKHEFEAKQPEYINIPHGLTLQLMVDALSDELLNSIKVTILDGSPISMEGNYKTLATIGYLCECSENANKSTTYVRILNRKGYTPALGLTLKKTSLSKIYEDLEDRLNKHYRETKIVEKLRNSPFGVQEKKSTTAAATTTTTITTSSRPTNHSDSSSSSSSSSSDSSDDGNIEEIEELSGNVSNSCSLASSAIISSHSTSIPVGSTVHHDHQLLAPAMIPEAQSSLQQDNSKKRKLDDNELAIRTKSKHCVMKEVWSHDKSTVAIYLVRNPTCTYKGYCQRADNGHYKGIVDITFTLPQNVLTWTDRYIPGATRVHEQRVVVDLMGDSSVYYHKNNAKVLIIVFSPNSGIS